VSAPGRVVLRQDVLQLGYPFRPALQVTPRDVQSMLDNPASKLVLIDCRTPGEWQTARIEGARLIPLNELASRIDEIDNAAADGGPVDVYRDHGVRARRAALFLRARGNEAESVAGGVDAWAGGGDAGVGRDQGRVG